MELLNVRKIYLEPNSTTYFTYFFDCEENNDKFLMVCKCLLTENKLTNWNARIVDGFAKESIDGFSVLRDQKCLVRINKYISVNSILNGLKTEVKAIREEQERKELERKEKMEEPASPDEATAILNMYRNQEHKDWYERSKSQEY